MKTYVYEAERLNCHSIKKNNIHYSLILIYDQLNVYKILFGYKYSTVASVHNCNKHFRSNIYLVLSF